MKHIKTYKLFESNDRISESYIRAMLFEFTDNNDFVIDIKSSSPSEDGLKSVIKHGYDNKYIVKISKHPLKQEDATLTKDMMDSLNNFIDLFKSENWQCESYVEYRPLPHIWAGLSYKMGDLIRVSIKDDISDWLPQGQLRINIGDPLPNLLFELRQY